MYILSTKEHCYEVYNIGMSKYLVHGRCENQIHKCDKKNYVQINKKQILFVAFNFFYMLLTLHFELFILILGYSMDALFMYVTLE
jgi:hypothetical protein